jgi:hypothetical protein
MDGIELLRPRLLSHLDTMPALVHVENATANGKPMKLLLVTRPEDADRLALANPMGWMLQQFRTVGAARIDSLWNKTSSFDVVSP